MTVQAATPWNSQATKELLDLAMEVKVKSSQDKSLFETTLLPWRSRLLACLENRADPNARLPSGQTVIEIFTPISILAAPLIEHGATLTQDLVPVLAQSEDSKRLRVIAPLQRQAYTSLAHACAAKFPSLDWYELVETSTNSFYSQVPASSFLEDSAPGFNAILERAQALGGLPVGRQVEDTKMREEIVRDLASIQPCLVWSGGHARVDLLRKFMRADVSANLVCEKHDSESPVRLLEYFLINHADLDVIEEVLIRGATVEFVHFLSAVEALAPPDAMRAQDVVDAVLGLLLQYADFDLDDPWPQSELPGTVRDFLIERAPGFMAQRDHEDLDASAHRNQAARRTSRL